MAKPIWIVSDIRRKTDIGWFRETYGDKIKTIRIEVDESVRKKRGWVFSEGTENFSYISIEIQYVV